MTDHHVDELLLRVRGRSGVDIRAAREFALAVLERAAADVEARQPGRFVFVRHLPVRWRLEAAALAVPVAVAVARCAADLADALTDAADLAGAPDPASGVAAFDDAAHWQAERVRAAVEGRSAWYFEPPGADPDPIRRWLDPAARAETVAVLTRLAADGHLARILTHMSADAVGRLVAVLGAPPDPDPLAVARWLEGLPRPEPASLNRATPGADSLSPAARLVLLFAETLYAGWPVVRVARVAILNDFGLHPETAGGPPVVTADPVTRPDAAAGESAGFADGPTRHGGLFLLLARVLELDSARFLWEAGLPVNEVFARAAAVLLRDPHDSAPGWFGGADPATPFTAAREQQVEFATAALRAYAEAAPRRGLADLPAAALHLVRRRGGRWLVASAADGAFVLFAHPADTPEELSAGMDTFLAAWPGAAVAPPALAGVDPSRRVRSGADASPREPFFPDGLPGAAGAVVPQVIGVMCQLFASRAGLPGASVSEFVARFLAIPARVRLEPESMWVILGNTAIDLAVRRAGLDADPGWVPWLGRTVRVEFEGGESV